MAPIVVGFFSFTFDAATPNSFSVFFFLLPGSVRHDPFVVGRGSGWGGEGWGGEGGMGSRLGLDPPFFWTNKSIKRPLSPSSCQTP